MQIDRRKSRQKPQNTNQHIKVKKHGKIKAGEKSCSGVKSIVERRKSIQIPARSISVNDFSGEGEIKSGASTALAIEPYLSVMSVEIFLAQQ